MANIRISTIGVGGTYPTVRAWWDAEGIESASGNLISLDLVNIAQLLPSQSHDIDVFSMGYSSFLNPYFYVDSNHYYVLRASPGYEFKGDFSDTSVPKLFHSSDTVPCFLCTVPYTRLENFILERDSNLDQYYTNNLIGLRLANRVIADSIGVKHVIASSISAINNTVYTIGIDAQNRATVRNSVVSDIKAFGHGTLLTPANINVGSYGINFDTTCTIKNNTVGNITAKNYNWNTSRHQYSKAYGLYCSGNVISETTVNVPGYASPECSGLDNGSDCSPPTSIDGNGLPYISGGMYNMSCQLAITISGYVGPGYPGCDNLNGLYTATWNGTKWEGLFPVNLNGGPTLSYPAGTIGVEFGAWVDSGGGVPTRAHTLLVKWYPTDDDTTARTMVGPEISGVIDCKNINVQCQSQNSIFSIACTSGTNTAIATVVSIPTTESSGTSYVVNSGLSTFNRQVENNVVFNIEASGSNFMLVEGFGIYPLSGALGNYNATQDSSAGYYPNITGINPSINFVQPAVNNFNVRLLPTAWQLIGSGISQSYQFLWDVEGQIRYGAWDIGADQHGSGLDSTRPDMISFNVWGHIPTSSNMNLWVSGDYFHDVMPLWIGSYDNVVSFNSNHDYPFRFPMFIYGSTPGTGVLYNSLNLQLGGISGFNYTNVPLFINSYDIPQIGTMPLWIGTYYEELDLLQSTYPTLLPIIGQPPVLPLFIEGSNYGGHVYDANGLGWPLFLQGVSGIYNTNMPLVVPNVFAPNVYPTGNVPSGINLYILGGGSVSHPSGETVPTGYPGTIPLFINGSYAVSASYIPLYISNSGLSSNIPLYVLGGGYNPDPYFVGTPGATGWFDIMPLFINRESNNEQRSMGLFLQTIAGSDSGLLNLYMNTGVSGITNNLGFVIIANKTDEATRLFTSGW